jgi:broad specificity phosphatase PhoE
MQIYLCRHGETQWTLTGQHTSFSDIPLTKHGREQAGAMGKHLQGIHFHTVLVSPMARAKETLALTGIQHPGIINPHVVEWDYGRYEGITTDQVHEKYPGWNIFDNGAPGGESLEEVSARADLVLKSLIYEKENTLIVSHGHFLRVLAARWLGLTANAGKLFTLSVASISILGYEREHHVIKMWNWTENSCFK